MLQKFQIMKMVFYLFIACFVFTSCSSPDKSKANENIPQVNRIKQSITTNPIQNYFSISRPVEKHELILDSTEFNRYFHPASTISKRPTTINFETEKVGAIILPETNRDTEIFLDSVYIYEDILNIEYSVKEGKEKRSFSTIPIKIFSFERNIPYQSVTFIQNQ